MGYPNQTYVSKVFRHKQTIHIDEFKFFFFLQQYVMSSNGSPL